MAALRRRLAPTPFLSAFLRLKAPLSTLFLDHSILPPSPSAAAGSGSSFEEGSFVLASVGSASSQGKPVTLVAWRPAHEQAILAARDKLDGAIMQPHTIYGRRSWVWGTWWDPLAEAAKSGSTSPVQVTVDRIAGCGVVHINDVAAGFHAAIDRIDGQLGSWPVFDLVTETLSVVEILENLENIKTILRVDGHIEYIGTHGNPFLEALSLVSKLDASRAKTALGWNPKRTEFLLNLPIYSKAWQASQ
ncbi:uncharacterized protein N7484_001787 [Penicillium longicatenatum]|uniref:uncharacterized protein n=1 Tax=Penicillium longicatenatum TaxID=1561947 RepID=UPI0025467A46|nr:uncharacterized protein N7484_001787 [Penicillium longicatenatum]KAJ5658138.1 hypothetical protein N7484_001787 [Penicillium longicatenatum]